MDMKNKEVPTVALAFALVTSRQLPGDRALEPSSRVDRA
jgi:hypothetical protein